jgi:hypothetical protein
MAGVLALSCAGSAIAFTDEIDAVWNDTAPTPRENCRNFMVKAWPFHLLRGRTSGRDCLVHAIKDYRDGDHEEAVGWLLAGACPNRQRQETLLKNAPIILPYLLRTYGDLVPE